MRALAVAVSMIALAACGMSAEAQRGDGRPDQRSYSVGAFHAVSLGGSPKVIVRVGPSQSVFAEGPSDQLDRLEVTVSNGELRIKRKDRSSWHMGPDKIVVHVTVPELTAASIGGSGDMQIDKVQADRFTASIGGSGDMNIGSLKATEAKFSIGGSGSITVAGTATRQDISIAGSGDVSAAGLESRTASVSVAGSGAVHTRATQRADISVLGSGDVVLDGGAQCAIRKAGSGSIRCGGSGA